MALIRLPQACFQNKSGLDPLYVGLRSAVPRPNSENQWSRPKYVIDGQDMINHLPLHRNQLDEIVGI